MIAGTARLSGNFGGSSNGAKHAVLGLSEHGLGRLITYGDSNCLDSSHQRSSCYQLLQSIIRYAAEVCPLCPPSLDLLTMTTAASCHARIWHMPSSYHCFRTVKHACPMVRRFASTGESDGLTALCLEGTRSWRKLVMLASRQEGGLPTMQGTQPGI